MLEAAFSLAVSICEAGVFLVDLYNEHYPLVSQLSAGSLSLDVHLGWALVFVFLSQHPPELSKQKLQGARVNPCPQGESQFLRLPFSMFLLSLMSALCECLSLSPVQ